MLHLLFASFFYVFFSGISDPPLADCLDTKSKQKSLDWIFSLKNYNYFNKIPKIDSLWSSNHFVGFRAEIQSVFV